MSARASEASLVSRAGDWAAGESNGGRHWLSVWAAPRPPGVCESCLVSLDNSQAGAVMAGKVAVRQNLVLTQTTGSFAETLTGF